MPTLTRYALRAALVSLVLALSLGMVTAVGGERWLALRPVYYHLLMMGWATQMIFGVAWWMFPRRLPTEPQTTSLSWVCFISLNLGLLLRAVAEPGVAWSGAPLFPPALHASSALMLLSVALFVVQMWRRVFER